MNELREILYLEEIETKEEDGRLRFRGKCQEADVVNANGRVYPFPILQREVEKLQLDIREKRILMMADHPATGRPSLQDTVARLDKLEWGGRGGKSLYLEGTLLNTSKGRDAREVMRSARIGLSSRGIGKTSSGDWQGEKADIVGDDYQLKSFDLVVGGSVKHAEITILREWAEDRDTDMGKLTESEKSELIEALDSMGSGNVELLNRWLDEFTDEVIEVVAEKVEKKEDALDLACALVVEHLGEEAHEELLKSLTRVMELEIAREQSEQLTENQKAQQRLCVD